MLSDVLGDVQTRLVAAGFTGQFLVGKRKLKQHKANDGQCRIVVVPTEDQLGAGATQDFNGPGPGRQRPLLSRLCGAEVHVWGVPPDPTAATADLDALAAAEALLHIFLRELRAVVRGQWKAVSGHWNNDTPDNVYGAEYILQITVDVPVVDVVCPPLPPGTKIQTTFTQGSTSEAG